MKVEYPSLFDPHKTITIWLCDKPCCDGKQLHREDGPAVIFPDGTTEWWRHGKRLTEAEARKINGESVARAVREGRSRAVVGPEKASFPPKSGKPKH